MTNDDLTIIEPDDNEYDRILDPDSSEARLIRASMFSGPLPPPEIMEHYDRIIPNGGDRILGMAENQQNHRIGMERAVIEGDVKRADIGLWLAFVIYFVLAGGAIFLLAIGRDIPGYVLLGSSVLGGLVNFIKVGRERKRELEEASGQRLPQINNPFKRKKKNKKKKKKKGKDKGKKKAKKKDKD